MTWMVIRLFLSLALIGGVLWFAAHLAKKKGLGQGNGLIQVVARQRLGRASTVNVVRIADVVLVIGATEEQVTLLAEVDGEAVDAALAERAPARPRPTGEPADAAPAVPTARPASEGVLAGSVLDRNSWGTLVDELRERTVRRP